MNREDLIRTVAGLADLCDSIREPMTLNVASILYTTCAALSSETEGELCDLVSSFNDRMINRLGFLDLQEGKHND